MLQGYVEHRLNTDNAWVETQAVNIHDDFNLVFPKVDLSLVVDNAATGKWMAVSKSMGVPAGQIEILGKVWLPPFRCRASSRMSAGCGGAGRVLHRQGD